MKAIWIAAAMMAAVYAATGAAQATDLYRWVDKNGVVHYGDVPLVEGAEQVKVNVQGEEPASGVSADVPYEARVAAQHFPVSLYVFEGCDDLCKQSRAYLKQRKVPYTEHVLKTQAEFEAFRQKNHIEGLPALSVGNKWLTGFEPGAWGNELDAAGYPK